MMDIYYNFDGVHYDYNISIEEYRKGVLKVFANNYDMDYESVERLYSQEWIDFDRIEEVFREDIIDFFRAKARQQYWEDRHE